LKRRNFLGSIAAGGLTGSFITSCEKPITKEDTSLQSTGPTISNKIAGTNLADHRKDLYDRLVNQYHSFWENGGFDSEFGGFICNLDDNGKPTDVEKYIWYQGRAVWVYSFLYNNFGKDSHWLEIARKTRDFMVKYMHAGDGKWNQIVYRDGRIKEGINPNIYGWLFASNGLAEYSKATGSEEDLELAKKSLYAALETYNHSDYKGTSNYGGLPKEIDLTGFRSQGHSMVTIRLLNQLLSWHDDPELEKLQAKHIDLIMIKFFNPEYGITNENLLYDYSRIPGYEDYMFTGHSLETQWMIMFEAIRKKDYQLFKKAVDNIKRFIMLSWDHIFGGFGDGHFYVFEKNHPYKGPDYRVKTMWSHCEVLIACLHIYEYTGEIWAKEYYEKIWNFVLKYIANTGHGCWRQAVDRLGNDLKREDLNPNRRGNFHQPRALMLNILSLDRMIKNNGKLTSFR